MSNVGKRLSYQKSVVWYAQKKNKFVACGWVELLLRFDLLMDEKNQGN